MANLGFSACSLSVFLAAVAGQAPRASAVLIEKELISSTVLNTLDVFGRSHTATGNAQLSMSPTGTLVVSNIGSSGLDGVTFPIGRVRGHSISMDMGDMGALSAGGLVEVCHPYSFGDQTVYVREDDAGSAVLGFSSTNPAGRCATVTILDNGTPVAQRDLDDDGFGDFGDLVSGDMGTDPATGQGVSISLAQVEWDYVCTITLPTDSQLTLTGPGQTPVTGDQISISLHGLPPGETVTGDVRVTCANLGQGLEITGERSILPSTRSRRGIITNMHPPGNPNNGFARVIPLGAVQTIGTPEAVFCNTFPNWGQQLDSLSPEGGLTVSNIGSSGLDGVRISYGSDSLCGPGFFTCPDGNCVADPASCDVVPLDRVVYFGGKDLASPDYLDLDDDGDTLRIAATGVSGGTFGTDLGTMSLTNDPGGNNQLTLDADFSSIGSDLMQIQVYSDGQIVGVFDHIRQPGGPPIGQITPSAAGMDITSCGKFVGGPPFGPPCFFFTTDGDFTLLGGGQVLVGDECRVLATGNPTPIEFISTFDLTGTSLEPFDMRILSDRERAETTGSATVAMGTLMHAEGGASVITDKDGSLRVSNLGSSGLDGVRIPLGSASGTMFELAQGGDFAVDSFFDIAYSISRACCLHDEDPDDLCVGLHAVTPGQVAVTGTATDPTALLTVTARDQFGNPLGSFTMDQTQAASVIDPSGVGINIVGGLAERRAGPGGGTIQCACIHLVADPGGGGGGGTTLTSPAGISYPDVYSVEVCVTTAAPFDAKYDGHVTVLKGPATPGGGPAQSDMVFSGLSKKGYDHYMAASGQARTAVVQCSVGGPGGIGEDLERLSVSNIGSSGEDGVSMDLSPRTCRLSVACCIDNDCDGDIDDIWMSVRSLDGHGNDGDLRVKIVGKKAPAGGGTTEDTFVFGCEGATAVNGGTTFGVSLTDSNLAVYEYHVRLRVTDDNGQTLALENETLYPSYLNSSPDLLAIDAAALDGRFSSSPTFEPSPTARWWVNQKMSQELIEPASITLLRSGQVVPNAAGYEITMIPIQATPVEVDGLVSMDVLLATPAGQIGSFQVTDSGITRAPPPCPADVNGDGVIDNGDIGNFISLFLAQDPQVDFTGDGVIDNGDISGFVNAFLAGC